MAKKSTSSLLPVLKRVWLLALPLLLRWWQSRQTPPRTVTTGRKSVPRTGGHGTPTPRPLPRRDAPPTKAKKKLLSNASMVDEQFRLRKSDVILTDRGTVVHLLPDDNDGSRHQRFLVEIARSDVTVKIAHNIDLAPRVPVSKGDRISFKGEYEYNELGGAVHWTHHDPKQWREGGWIDHAGVRYE